MVPSRLLALGLDADFDALFLFEQVQGQVSGYRQIAVGVARSDPVPVLIEGHVQDPGKLFSIPHWSRIAFKSVAAAAAG